MNRALPFVLAMALLPLAGCVSHTARKPDPNYFGTVDRPPPVFYNRAQQVSARAQKLLSTGKFQKRADALKAAESEVSVAGATVQAKWAQQQAEARNRAAVQEKFDNDLRKLGHE